MQTMLKTTVTLFLFFLLTITQAQKVIVNTVGKDPFNGKADEIVYKAKEGEWTFQSYSFPAIKATYRPTGYTWGEQVSDAVIAKPQPLTTKITVAISQTIELENNTSIVIQKDKLYFKSGKEVKVKSASFFTQGDNNGFRFQLSDQEKFFGGGERALPMDRRGYRFNLYNVAAYGYGLGADNLNFSVPVLLSSNGYALFFDNPSKGYFDIGLTDKNVLEAGFVSGELTFYVVFGKNMDEMLRNYTAITGRQPLPPRWALGNFVSRFGYRSEEQVQQVVKKMRDEKFPMDGLIFDLFWFGDEIKGTLGNLDWVNTTKWPNPKLMMENFKVKDNLKTILITEPFILNSSKTFTEATPFLATDAAGKAYNFSELYFGNGGLLDVFRKPAQDWIWKYYKKQVSNGAAGWWSDLGEPEKHPAEVMHNLKDYGVNRLMGADEVHNIYGHYWSKMLFEKYRDDFAGTRLFHLNRAGFAGSQRYSVFPWTGDVARSWSGLKSQFPVLLGMSASGLPYVHSDAGGFAAADQADAELYTRWLQFAAFTPVFRPHGTALEDYDKAVKSIPSEPALWEEPTKSIVRNYINLRYQLLPYNYTLSYEQAVLGKPLMRPLYYYNFADADAIKAEDEYYWGDNLLVAPVTSQGATTKSIYLPEGKWYNFYDNTLVNGKQWLNQPVDIRHIPLFVKAGGFIPLWQADSIKSVETYNSKDISLLYYPGETSSYVFYDDDGASTKTLEKADYELITFTASTQGTAITIDIKTNNEALYKRKQVRKFTFLVPATASFTTISVNGKPAAAAKAIKPISLVSGKFASAVIEFNGKPTQALLVK
jgi:oligosaccharide 4-alpha-D-glucosyltransferase